MTTARHSAKVEKGQVIFADPVAWRANVSKHEGYPVWVTVTRVTKPRTLSQNALYHVWMAMIADHIGDSAKAVHEQMKAEFLQRRNLELLNGKTMSLPPTTTILTTSEMSLYMEKVSAWAGSFLGLYLPSGDQIAEGL